MIELKDLQLQEEKIDKLRNKSYKLNSSIQNEESSLQKLYEEFIVHHNLFKDIVWILTSFEFKYDRVEFRMEAQSQEENTFIKECRDIEFEKSIRLSIFSGISCSNFYLGSSYNSDITFLDFQNFIKKYELKIIGHSLDKEFKEIEERYKQMQMVKDLIKGNNV